MPSIKFRKAPIILFALLVLLTIAWLVQSGTVSRKVAQIKGQQSHDPLLAALSFKSLSQNEEERKKYFQSLHDGCKIEADALKRHVQYLSELDPPRNYLQPDSLNVAAKYIEEQWKTAGLTVQRQEYEVDNQKYSNLTSLMGKTESPRFVIGAHYDAVRGTPGADDNASGVAVLLEVAKTLGIKPVNTENIPLSLEWVAYTLEEPPYFRTENMGSAVHAKSLKEQNITVAGMMSLEMLGFYKDEEKTQEFPSPLMAKLYGDKGNFLAIVGNIKSNALVAALKTAFKTADAIRTETLVAPEMLPGVDFSDHLNYWKYNWTAVMLTDTAYLRNPHYHEKTDTVDTLDFTRMTAVARSLCFTLRHLLQQSLASLTPQTEKK